MGGANAGIIKKKNASWADDCEHIEENQ
jgi:hypothetical protein